MKLFTNLAATLRVVFSFLRVASLIPVLLVVLGLVLVPWMKERLDPGTRLSVAVGEISLPGSETRIEPKQSDGDPAPVGIEEERGELKVDLLSLDGAGRLAVWQTLLPSKLLLAVFGWVLFGLLRNICANIGRGEIFTSRNVTMVETLGVVMIAYNLGCSGVEWWARQAMGGYIQAHFALVTPRVTELATGRLFDLETSPPSLLIGVLVLLMAEVFRQGLALKTENDLTV